MSPAYPNSVLLEMARKQPGVKELFTSTLQKPWFGSLVTAEPLEAQLRAYRSGVPSSKSSAIAGFRKIDQDLAVELQRRQVGASFVHAALPLPFPPSKAIPFDNTVLPLLYEMTTFDMLHMQNIAEMAWKGEYVTKQAEGEKAVYSIMCSKLTEYGAAQKLFASYAAKTGPLMARLAPNMDKHALQFFVDAIARTIETFNGILKDIGQKG